MWRARWLEQRVVAEFMAAGYFARHLKRMRALYAARRGALADGLAAAFGDRSGLSVEALSRRGTAPACGQGLLLGFTNIAETDALSLCRRLHQIIGKSLDNEAVLHCHASAVFRGLPGYCLAGWLAISRRNGTSGPTAMYS